MAREKSARQRAAARGKAMPSLDLTAVRTNQMIVDFMKTSSRVEHHLQEKHSLTDLQYESIVTTVQGL